MKSTFQSAERNTKQIEPERWKQQLLAWRLAAYEGARKWEMIEYVARKSIMIHVTNQACN
jgi:hypothetical protein